MGLKSEVLALSFGALLILVTFGDSHIYTNFLGVGNLDTMFGVRLWPAMDIFYPLASIVIFLLYGWVKGNGIKINFATVFLFASFVAALLIMNIDDVGKVLKITLNYSTSNWTLIMWFYPIYSAIAFFLFGEKNKH